MAALGLNLAWEWIYGVRGLVVGPSPQAVINIIWGVADLVIVYTFLRYGRSELPRFVTAWMFAIWGVVLFGVSFAVQGMFLAHFEPFDAARYSAFLQNALMSGLFVAMFVARGGMRGQSRTIAVAKWVGTLAPTILYGVILDAPFILGLGIICSVFDLIYIVLVFRARAWAVEQQRPTG